MKVWARDLRERSQLIPCLSDDEVDRLLVCLQRIGAGGWGAGGSGGGRSPGGGTPTTGRPTGGGNDKTSAVGPAASGWTTPGSGGG